MLRQESLRPGDQVVASCGSVSVILYTQNLARGTSTALTEILAQSREPLEVIVVDDASNDDTIVVVQEFQRRHSGIRLIRHRERVGRIMSLNQALSVAEGDYVYMADVDGSLCERFFEKAINLLARHPGAGFCYCASRPGGLEACERRGTRAAWSSTPCYLEPAEVAAAFSGWHLCAAMAVFDRRILIENHGLPRELSVLADWFALLTSGLRNGACYIPETLATLSPRAALPAPPPERDKALAHFLRLMRSDACLDLLGLMIGADVVAGLRPHIERVIEGDPEHWEAESLLLIGHSMELAGAKNRARVLLERGRGAAAAGRLIDAQHIFADAVREFPNVHGVRLLFARIAIARGDYETASKHLEVAKSLAPDDPEVYLQVSKVHSAARDYEKTEEALRRAVALDPSNLAVLLSLAEVIQLQGRDDEAAMYYNESLAKNPENSELLNAVGKLALGLGQSSNARIAFEQALSVNPGCDEAKRALIELGSEDTGKPGERCYGRETDPAGVLPHWERGGSVRTQVPSAITFHFVVAVWGESYTRLFLDVVLPSQMTPGNLEAFRAHPRCTYKIYTSAADAASIRLARAYVNLRDIVPAEIITMVDLDVGDKYASMSACHGKAVAAAAEVGATLIILCPDAVLSEGALARCAMLAGSGKRAVMLPGLRTVKETFAPALVGQIRRNSCEGWRLPSSRELVKLAMEHLHPVSAQHIWTATDFTTFPSFLLWEVPGQGWLARSFHLHPLMMNPVRRHVLPEGTIDAKYVDAAFPDPRDVYVVEDSDEMVQIEISTGARTVPRTEANKASVLAVVRSANVFALPLHRAMLQRRVFLHAGDIGPEWGDTVRDSDHIVDSINFFFKGLDVNRPHVAS